jgi:RsiW-degrading membrane proteinase PrsW (M82 family)
MSAPPILPFASCLLPLALPPPLILHFGFCLLTSDLPPTPALLILAIAPSAALFIFFYARDRHNREPFGTLAKTFLLGAAAIIPAMLVSVSLARLFHWSGETPNLLSAFLGALFIVGFVEEGCKYVVVRFYSFHRPDFDEPYDGIMYSVMAALGFATVENVLFVLTTGAGAGVMRALLSVPSHAFDGVLMGYFLGEAKFAQSDRRGNWLSALGFSLAVLAHGIYDFIVFTVDKRPLLLGSLVVLAALSWVIIFKATRQLSDQSPFRRPQLAELHKTGVKEPERKEEPPPAKG